LCEGWILHFCRHWEVELVKVVLTNGRSPCIGDDLLEESLVIAAQRRKRLKDLENGDHVIEVLEGARRDDGALLLRRWAGRTHWERRDVYLDRCRRGRGPRGILRWIGRLRVGRRRDARHGTGVLVAQAVGK
jgi:hypothetical protein